MIELAFLHIPKTAGRTLVHHIAEQFPKEAIVNISRDALARKRRKLRDLVGPDTRVIMGHLWYREVEEFLYTHPKISEVQVFGVPDERMGEQVCAWVQLKPGESATPEEITDFCKGKITHFKIPKYIKFVEEYPMTVTGKMQKFVMREQYLEELDLG